jgi:predicted GIY-YIG superfamily endonuclease
MPHVYILKCSDGSYYVGSTVHLERRLAEHQMGLIKGYTASRRPVELVWSAEFPAEHDAFLRERQIKGWSRAKKEALIHGAWAGIHQVVKGERKRREAMKRGSR